MFTLEEYKIIAELIDITNLQGTIYTLPVRVSKLTQLRVKVQGLIEATEKEYARNEVRPENVASDDA